MRCFWFAVRLLQCTVRSAARTISVALKNQNTRNDKETAWLIVNDEPLEHNVCCWHPLSPDPALSFIQSSRQVNRGAGKISLTKMGQSMDRMPPQPRDKWETSAWREPLSGLQGGCRWAVGTM